MRTTALLLVTLAACVDAPTIDDTAQPLVHTTIGPTWRYPTIHVCFENTSWQYATQRAWIQEAVEQVWEAESKVDFVGWAQCAFGEPGVHVAFGPATTASGRGPQLDGITGGVTIKIAGESSDRIHRDAVWVFEEVLGGCFGFASGGSTYNTGPCTWGPSYVPTWPFALSPLVHADVRNFYGARDGSLVMKWYWLSDDDVLCVGADGPGMPADAMFPCDGAPNHIFPLPASWRPPLHDYPLRLATDWCLEPGAGTTQTGLQHVDADRCNPRTSTTWQIGDEVQISTIGGWCLGYDTSAPFVQLEECKEPFVEPRAETTFSLGTGGWFGFRIRDRVGRCLGPIGREPGLQVGLFPCSDPDELNWSWTWSDGGVLRHTMSGLCIEPYRPARGEPPHLANCDGGTPQRFSLDTQLRHDTRILDWYPDGEPLRLDEQSYREFRYFP